MHLPPVSESIESGVVHTGRDLSAFRTLRSATKGRRPLETCELLKKLDQNFYIDIAGCETETPQSAASAQMRILTLPPVCAKMSISF